MHVDAWAIFAAQASLVRPLHPENAHETILVTELGISMPFRLLKFGRTNKWNEDLVFYSDSTPGKPIDHKVISDGYNREVAFLLGQKLVEEDYKRENPHKYYTEILALGEEERKRRRLVFHSQRRFFDQLRLNTIGRESTQKMIGHKTDAMSDFCYNNVLFQCKQGLWILGKRNEGENSSRRVRGDAS